MRCIKEIMPFQSNINNTVRRSISPVHIFSMFISFIILCVFFSTIVLASDTLSVENAVISAGDTESVPIFLYNNEFPVAGFTLRLELGDSLLCSIIGVEKGRDIEDFEYFVDRVNTGSCRVTAIANWPGGGNPSPLIRGRHEIVRILIAVSSNTPMDYIDSLYFKDDSLPPERDNSIADDTGYRDEVPALLGGKILTVTPSGTDDHGAILPDDIELSQNYPNPFNATTNLSFRLGRESGDINLAIYDSLGRRAKGYFWPGLSAGEHTVVWDGSNESGETVSSGPYFYNLTVAGIRTATKSMMLLK